MSFSNIEILKIENNVCKVSCCEIMQTGFWIENGIGVTCAHGFKHLYKGDTLCIDNIDEKNDTGTAKVLSIDINNDILLFEIEKDKFKIPLFPFLCEAPPFNSICYLWGFTEIKTKGESETLTSTGYSRAPLEYKFSVGLIQPGMSGAPIFYKSKEDTIYIVGMIKTSRDITINIGARAIPASTVKTYLKGILYPNSDFTFVSREDLSIVNEMNKVAYHDTKPIIPYKFEEGEDINSLDDEMKNIFSPLVNYDNLREKAIYKWYDINSHFFRFIVSDSENIKNGVTCVLPLTFDAYMNYRTGKISEFDFDENHIMTNYNLSKKIYVCFQSFAISSEFKRPTYNLLLKSILEHVKSILTPNNLEIIIIAEIGTSSGRKIAKKFNLGISGLSNFGRPIFEKKITIEELKKHNI